MRAYAERQMGGLRTLGVGLTGFVLAGCWVAYHPQRPHEATSDGVTARVMGVDTFLNVLSVDVAVDAPAGYRTANAWLTTPATTPCTDGLAAWSQSPGALHADQRVFSFDAGAAGAMGLFAAAPTVIDLD